jgi:hypothetical protein
MDLIYEEKRDGTHLLFFLSTTSNISYLKDHVKSICEQVISNPVLRRFRRMEIIIHNEDVLKKRIRSSSWDFYQTQWRGYTEKKISNGKNRVHINEEIIIAYRYLLRLAKPTSNPTDAVWNEICIAAAKDAVGVIVHEITHLWHLRINPTRRLIRKQWARFKRAYSSSVRNSRLFMADENAGHCWALFGTNLLTLMEQVVTEGFAAFHEELQKGSISYSQESLREHYEHAAGIASNLNRDLELLYEKFSISIKDISAEKISEVKAKFYEITKLMPQYCNSIGMHLHHLVLFLNENLTDEKIVHFSYLKLIKIYESSCISLGWQPVVSLNAEGIFSLKNHISKLTILRKSGS